MRKTISKRLFSIFIAFTLIFSLAVIIPGDKYSFRVEATDTVEGKKVVQVALGGDHSACITEDGCLYTWGFNYNGQLGDGTNDYRNIPTKIMDNVKQVSLGYNHTACITEDGTLYTWGSNNCGQLGDGTKTYYDSNEQHEVNNNRSIPVKIMDNAKYVSLGGMHSACITQSGELYMWGNGYEGCLGFKCPSYKLTPEIVMENVAQVSLGYKHSACVTNDGSLYTWGMNNYGQLGDGTVENSFCPILIMDNVKQVDLGSVCSSCITCDNELYTWGYNLDGHLGTYSNDNVLIPQIIKNNITYVSLGDSALAYISNDSTLSICGSLNISGSWKDGIFTDFSDNILLSEKYNDVIQVCVGMRDISIINSYGLLFCKGDITSYINSDGNSKDYTKIVIPNDTEDEDNTTTITIPGKNPNLSESYNTGSFGSDDYIIQEVKKYCTDGKDEFVERIDQILNENISWPIKQNELLKVFNQYGINDIHEGFKIAEEKNDYLSQTLPYRYNYNLLVTDEFYCAYQYDYEIKNNLAKKTALGLSNLIFNDSDLTSQISDAIFRPDMINNYPEAKKNKEMLREFLETVQENKATDILNNSLDFAETALEVFNTDEAYEAQFNHIMEKLSVCTDKKEAEKLMQEGANYLLENTKLKDGSIALNTKSIAKALGKSSSVIKFGTATTNDVLAFIYLEQELAIYQNNMEFLKTIVENENATIYMRLAANSLLNDIDNKYKELVLHFCGNVFDLTLGVCNYDLWTELLGESVGDFLATYRLAVVISNMMVDTGDFCKQTAYAQGYAQLSAIYADILKKDRETFLANETADNAWKFFSDYSVLWNLRQCGEYQYEKAQHVKTFMGLFNSVPYNYPYKITVVNATLKALDNAKFTIDKSESIPDDVYYMKKAVIHCPVDVLVYNEKNELIAELKDGEESDITNDYGRFAVVYNPFTEEFEKVICQSKDADLKIEMSAVDDGMVDYEFAYLDNSENIVINKFNMEKVNQNDKIILSTSETTNSYDIDKDGDGTIDETKDFIPAGSEIKSIEKITSKQNNLSLKVNESSVITIDNTPVDASYTALEWRSEKPEIAKIENGKIIALSEGTTKIHVFALNNPEAKLEIMVNVLPYGDTATFVGDVNGDGKINVTDVSKTAAHVKGIRPLDEKEQKHADVNGDNKINVTDVSKIAAHVKGIRALQKNNDNQNDTSNSDPKDNSETENVENDPNEINNGEYAEILYDKECGRWYVEDDDGNALPLTCTYDPDKEIWYTSNGKELNVVHSDNVKNPNYELPDKVAYLVLPNGEAMQLSNIGYLNTIYNEIDGHKVSAIGYRFNTPWVYGGNYGLIDPNNNDSGIKMTIPDNITYCGSASMLTWGLNELQLSDSLLCIEDSAFMVYDGTSLNDTTFNDLKLNNGLKYIGDKAFFGYSALTSVNIPSSVNHIGDYAFGYYTDIEKLQEYYQEHIGDEDYELKSPEKFYKKIEDFTIYGKKGTEAERYAEANGFIFIDNNEVLPDLISLNETSLTLDEGSSAQLTATISPDNAKDKSITWSSSDTSVATISNGKVTAISEGKTTITANTTNGKTASCSITVKEIQPSSITLNKTSLTLDEGSSAQLTATISPDNAKDKSVTWSSSDTSVATVSNGKVTAISEGKVTISVKTVNNKTAFCSLTVRKPQEEYIKIYTANDLYNIRKDLDANYVLMNDIDLSGYSNWEPIGAVNNGFTGVFDGNHHSVNNMEITGEYTSTRNFTKGLFSYSDGATFKNLTLAGDIDIVYYGKSGQGPSVGMLCAYADNSTVENCTVSQSSTINVLIKTSDKDNAVTSSVGGLVGVEEHSNFIACKNYAGITNSVIAASPKSYSGGIIGHGFWQSNITSCENYGDISSITQKTEDTNEYFICYSYSGGIIGTASEKIVDNCLNYGNIYSKCESTVKTNVVSTASSGGLIGEGKDEIKNSSSFGTVKASGESDNMETTTYESNSIGYSYW